MENKTQAANPISREQVPRHSSLLAYHAIDEDGSRKNRNVSRTRIRLMSMMSRCLERRLQRWDRGIVLRGMLRGREKESSWKVSGMFPRRSANMIGSSYMRLLTNDAHFSFSFRFLVVGAQTQTLRILVLAWEDGDWAMGSAVKRRRRRIWTSCMRMPRVWTGIRLR